MRTKVLIAKIMHVIATILTNRLVFHYFINLKAQDTYNSNYHIGCAEGQRMAANNQYPAENFTYSPISSTKFGIVSVILPVIVELAATWSGGGRASDLKPLYKRLLSLGISGLISFFYGLFNYGFILPEDGKKHGLHVCWLNGMLPRGQAPSETLSKFLAQHWKDEGNQKFVVTSLIKKIQNGDDPPTIPYVSWIPNDLWLVAAIGGGMTLYTERVFWDSFMPVFRRFFPGKEGFITQATVQNNHDISRLFKAFAADHKISIAEVIKIAESLETGNPSLGTVGSDSKSDSAASVAISVLPKAPDSNAATVAVLSASAGQEASRKITPRWQKSLFWDLGITYVRANDSKRVSKVARVEDLKGTVALRGAKHSPLNSTLRHRFLSTKRGGYVGEDAKNDRAQKFVTIDSGVESIAWKFRKCCLDKGVSLNKDIIGHVLKFLDLADIDKFLRLQNKEFWGGVSRKEVLQRLITNEQLSDIMFLGKCIDEINKLFPNCLKHNSASKKVVLLGLFLFVIAAVNYYLGKEMGILFVAATIFEVEAILFPFTGKKPQELADLIETNPRLHADLTLAKEKFLEPGQHGLQDLNKLKSKLQNVRDRLMDEFSNDLHDKLTVGGGAPRALRLD